MPSHGPEPGPGRHAHGKLPAPSHVSGGCHPTFFISVRPSGGGAVRPGSRHGSALGESSCDSMRAVPRRGGAAAGASRPYHFPHRCPCSWAPATVTHCAPNAQCAQRFPNTSFVEDHAYNRQLHSLIIIYRAGLGYRTLTRPEGHTHAGMPYDAFRPSGDPLGTRTGVR